MVDRLTYKAVANIYKAKKPTDDQRNNDLSGALLYTVVMYVMYANVRFYVYDFCDFA